MEALAMLFLLGFSVGKWMLLVMMPIVLVYKFKPTRKIIDKYFEFY